MSNPAQALTFFFYGLPFFCMGLAVWLELGRTTDRRLRHSLPALAAFGIAHGVHEWLEVTLGLSLLPPGLAAMREWETIRIALLAVSFLLLGAFGASLLSPTERIQQRSRVIPMVLTVVWAAGMFVLARRLIVWRDLVEAADVWTRYTLAVPSAVLASAGLLAQRRVYQRGGMPQFGFDCLMAAVALAVYGLFEGVFSGPSVLATSQVINEDLFLRMFGFPIQWLRAAAALVTSIFVIRFMRSFEVQLQRKMAQLQAAQLEEVKRREMLRREYLKRVVAAQEAERQRIARELHDETGQALTAIGLGLRAIAGTLKPEDRSPAQNLHHLETLATHSLDELQRLIADLRPSHLDDLGLPSALRWYANEIQCRAPIQVTVEVTGESREIPPAVNTALFRLAQEALTNVTKHADADHARMHVTYGPTAVTLLVEDDGRGFDPSQVRQPTWQAWGLVGMEERAALLGGELTLESRPGGGTRVSVTFPYAEEIRGENGDALADH